MAAGLAKDVFPPLALLLKAQSKEFVRTLFHEAFRYRADAVPVSVLKNVAASLDAGLDEARLLMESLVTVVHAALFECLTDPKAVYDLFPENFHKNLRELISKIIAENMPLWRTNAINQQVSLPKLIDFDWRVDVKTSSNVISRLSMPTCIIQLQVQENAVEQNSMPSVRRLNVELTKEKLDTMLDGLGKIRDQLSSVSK
ncbi:COMM domain-containing protein 9-like [Stylophora pistillata]|uniref:COMM domain-containing protein 9 n=1 Tax=Stylophora pistillata TaxID=50429 RepID=A0A2B4S3P6_STYPI|nr:COMM domain-containing protein 9-like [Stylophora pistillata]PFX23669.1 COMM domain-containing protein 9 [Stylophora pistillata]